MKVRVLYPSAFVHLPKPPAASDVIDISEDDAKRYTEMGYVEAVDAKPAQRSVETTTAEPGAKRAVGRPRKAKA